MPDTTLRRDFLKASASAAALIALPATTSRAAGANDRLRVGLIGCGGRGTHDAGLFANTPNVEVSYVCDTDQGRLASAAKGLHVSAAGVVSDLRRILDDK